MQPRVWDCSEKIIEVVLNFGCITLLVIYQSRKFLNFGDWALIYLSPCRITVTCFEVKYFLIIYRISIRSIVRNDQKPSIVLVKDWLERSKPCFIGLVFCEPKTIG